MIPLTDELPRRSRPYVNIALIAINGVVFLLELFMGSGSRELSFYRWGLIPTELWHGTSFQTLRTFTGDYDISSPVPTWGTVFSSMFIHADILHFGFNMLFLWVFGDNVEDRLGHVKYLLFYLGAGLAAAWTQTALDPNGDVPMIGASGAIAGVLGAYLVLYPLSQVRTLVFALFVFFVRIPAVFLLGFWVLLQFFEGLGSLGPSAQSGGTAYWAHVGGFALGALVTLLLKVVVWREQVWPQSPRTPRPPPGWIEDDR